MSKCGVISGPYFPVFSPKIAPSPVRENAKKKQKKHVYCNYYDTSTTYFDSMLLRDKCPNAELFLVRIFLYLVQIQENTDQK